MFKGRNFDRSFMRIPLALLSLLLLAGCYEKDPNYDQLASLGEDARLVKFRAFPLAERFRLYDKIYWKSGHPHDAELAEGFRDKPDKSMVYIIQKLQNSKLGDFDEYFPIIYDLDAETSVNVCESEYILPLRKIVSSYNPAKTGADFSQIKFKKCQL